MKPIPRLRMPYPLVFARVVPLLTCLLASRLPAAPAAGAWPAVDGAVFALRDADPTKTVLAFDAKGRKLLAFDCAPQGRALVGRFHDFLCDGGWFHARQAAAWAGSMVKAKDAFSLEATITPAVARPGGTGVVVAYTNEVGEDAAILQTADGLALRIHGKEIVPLFPIAAGRAVHLIVAAGNGRWQAYRYGALMADGLLPADSAAWSGRELVFGAGWGGSEPWRGRLESIAIFPRAFTPDEAKAESAGAAGLRAGRPEAATIHFRGTLLRQADTTDVTAMLPYTRSLTAAEYKVDDVLEGKWTEPTITVLHWMVLDGKRLPIADREPGARVDLLVEPLAQHPQLESCRRDELVGGDLSAEIFYCEAEKRP